MPAGLLGETGGALFNAGALEAQDTDFTENVAQDDGLAVYNEHSEFLVLQDVTFTGNTRSCPSGEYSSVDDVSRVDIRQRSYALTVHPDVSRFKTSPGNNCYRIALRPPPPLEGLNSSW